MQFSMYFFQTIFWLSLLSSLVEVRRVELLTSCLQGRRSSQLSYTPIVFLFFNVLILSYISITFNRYIEK